MVALVDVVSASRAPEGLLRWRFSILPKNNYPQKKFEKEPRKDLPYAQPDPKEPYIMVVDE